MSMMEQLYLELEDKQWPFQYVSHDRQIARAIVFDDAGFYFVRVQRDDDFGKATYIETAGGGVEPGEELNKAILRELKEELGAEAELICKIGVVSDYYNLIHRHNINHYFLCRAKAFGSKNLTQDEIDIYHLSTTRLSFEDAVAEYEKAAVQKVAQLVAARELPILRRAKEIIDNL